MAGSTEWTRRRVTITSVLVLAIGAAGAMLLPRLLHDPGGRPGGTAHGQVCVAAPGGTGAIRAGNLRLTARRPGSPDFADSLPVADHTPAQDIALFLAADAGRSGWPRPAAVEVSGECLQFAEVTSLGGTPGETGLEMSWGLSARDEGAIAVRIRVVPDPPDAAPSGGGKVVLTGRPALRDAGGAAAEAAVEFGAVPPSEVLGRLADALRAEGWTVEAAPTTGAVTVRSLPGGKALGAVLLSFRAADGPAPPLLWAIEVL